MRPSTWSNCCILEQNYGEFRRKSRLWRVCKSWFQATLDEAGTKQLSVMYRFKQVLESGNVNFNFYNCCPLQPDHSTRMHFGEHDSSLDQVSEKVKFPMQNTGGELNFTLYQAELFHKYAAVDETRQGKQ
jgi:hypothetical protein